MLSFESDYIEGAHPVILQRLLKTNMEQVSGYGNDPYCECAKEKIRQACKCPQADIHFLVGGTQTNAIVISSMLRSYEGVIAADTGHVATHEAGAIELTGHKVLELPQGANVDTLLELPQNAKEDTLLELPQNAVMDRAQGMTQNKMAGTGVCLSEQAGKINASVLETYLREFYKDENHEHMVFPGMVYISHPTEYGTLYSAKELKHISEVCRAYHLPLYMDGARLGYALMSKETDVTLPMIAEYCDVFYIGGTKVGALCGEAVVFTKNNTPPHFMTMIKQRGGLLAKGRLLGIQFDSLFSDDLYLKCGKHAIQMAEEMKQIFKEKGYHFYLETPTNQQFIILENQQMETLKQKVNFSFWMRLDEKHSVVRFATSWATKTENLEQLREALG